MTIEFLNERISKAEEKINKKNGTIQKKTKLIEKKTASLEKLTGTDKRWMEYDIENLEDDIKRLKKEVEEAEASLVKYQDLLSKELEKAASRNVPAILEFLANWKKKVMDYYTKRFERYLEAKAEYYKKSAEHTEWFNHGGWNAPNRKEVDAKYNEYRKDYYQKWREMERYELRVYNRETGKYDFKFDREKLQKELDQEANMKYDDIINRTNEICGKIVDAKGLWVGYKGELDGIVIGERGKAKIETIGAGGYNIQCFHFRTLIHEI